MKNNKKQLKSISIVICILALPFVISPLAYAAVSISLDNTQMSNSFGTAANPDIIWTGLSYGLTWQDGRRQGEPEIYFTKLNGLGVRVSKELKISNSSDKISDEPAITWAGNAYGVVWYEYYGDESENNDGCNVYFARLNKEGEKRGGIISVTPDNDGACSGHPAISWANSTYGITWHRGYSNNETSQIFFRRLDPFGQGKGEEIQVSETLNSENPSIAWTGLEYGIAWQANDGIYFTRLDADGIKQGDALKISNISASSTNPAITWQGSEYGVVWQGYDTQGRQQIYFTKLNERGYKQIEDVTITSNRGEDYSVSPSIIWGNSEYGITWQQGDDLVYFIALGAEGNKKSKILQISNTDDDQSKQPSIASGTSQYVFVWHEIPRDGGKEIYLAKLAFSDVDKNNLQFFLAFIENLNGNSWLFIILALAVVVLIMGVIYLIKRKWKSSQADSF